MMRAIRVGLVGGVAIALLTSCSGGGSAAHSTGPGSHTSPTPHPSPSPSPTLSVNQLLQRTIVPDSAMGKQGLDTQGDPAEFVTAENVRYALVEVCDHALPSDSRIDAAWQAQWGAEYSPTAPSAAREMSVHYRAGTGASAVAELASALTCSGYSAGTDHTSYRLDGKVTLPKVVGADAQLGFCSALAGLTLVECTAVVGHGSFAAALTVRAPSESVALDSARKLAPALGTALATVNDPASPSSTPSQTSPPPSVTPTHTAGPWTAAEARTHFLATIDSIQNAAGPVEIEKDLDDAPEDAANLDGVNSYANDYADRLRIVAANLGLGQRPAKAKSPIMKLITAAKADRAPFLRLGKSTTWSTFKARYPATKAPDAAFARAVTAARLALGLPQS